jgi:hypothetical protein
MLARLSACALLLLLGACAAALPGYVPPSQKAKSKFSTAYTSGEVNAEGHYEMSEQEKLMDCKRTTGAMLITISWLRHRHSEVGTSSVAVAGSKVAQPFIGGSGKGLDRDAEYVRSRARLDAFNRHLAAQKCATVDIDAELAKSQEAIGKKY